MMTNSFQLYLCAPQRKVIEMYTQNGIIDWQTVYGWDFRWPSAFMAMFNINTNFKTPMRRCSMAEPLVTQRKGVASEGRPCLFLLQHITYANRFTLNRHRPFAIDDLVARENPGNNSQFLLPAFAEITLKRPTPDLFSSLHHGVNRVDTRRPFFCRNVCPSGITNPHHHCFTANIKLARISGFIACWRGTSLFVVGLYAQKPT